MLGRLIRNWVYGGSLAGVLLLALTPVLTTGWSWPLTAVFLTIPVYMLHQYEEHDADRFRAKVNEMFGKGHDVLPVAAVFVINVPGVWGVNALAFALAASVGMGWGLIALYTMLANSLVHVVQAVVTRGYNPGLVTSIVLFLPLGVAGSWAVNATTGAVTMAEQVTAIAVAVLIHIAIQAYVLSNVRRLSRQVS
ncbi:MAG: hypothetical protein JWP26_2849 [Devosia sp.]|uniref:HXXEE domain-containing protein n=1 Tax=Devosia sp. TaxID=1871048 RepID=UPI002627CC83|nr:HXXEE domain-containing protein [Devosia sp.]MDB5587879.1 hypothetical protein [Devosia sp.]